MFLTELLKKPFLKQPEDYNINVHPKKVQKVRCHYTGRGSNLVEILSPETTRFEVYTSAYPYLEKLIRKYNPNADIKD